MRQKLRNEKNQELKSHLESILEMVGSEYAPDVKSFFSSYGAALKSNEAAGMLIKAYIRDPQNVPAQLWKNAEESVPAGKRDFLETLKAMREPLEDDGQKIDKRYKEYGSVWGRALQASIEYEQAVSEVGSGLRQAQRFATAGDEIHKAIQEKRLSQASGDALMKEHSDMLLASDNKLAPYVQIIASGWGRMAATGEGDAKFVELLRPVISQFRDAPEPVSVLTPGNQRRVDDFCDYLDDSSETLGVAAYQNMYKIGAVLSLLLRPKTHLTP